MNSRRGRSDPTLMLSILAAAIALSAWQAISKIPADRLSVAVGWLYPTALGLTVIASALATQRYISTRRTLRRRSTVAVVPADEFDASPEAVQRFASQLAQMDRGVRGWLDRPARALGIRLESDREGRLVYLLEAPDRAGGLLRSALGGYDGIELRNPDVVLDGRSDPGGRTTLRTELVLARPSIEPLSHLAFDPDPLQPFAAAMAGTGPDEEVSVRVDLLPAKGHRRARIARRLRRQAKRLGIEGQPIQERLGLPVERREVDPATAAERRLRGRGLDHKLRDGGQPFETQILVRVSAPGRHRAKALMQNVLAAFESVADRNWLKASGLPVPGLAFLGSDLPVRRARFDRRCRTGLFRPARQNILTARELAGFLKPPTMFCPADNVLRSGPNLPPPPPLPDLEPESKAMVPLGRVTDETGERLIAFRTADTFFSYVAGRSRYGKTELAICQFLHLVRSGHGGLFLDPHADALERMRPYLDRPGVRERVVEINLAAGSAGNKMPGWNLFELGGQGAGEAEARVEAVVDAFASAMQWGERSTRAINLTTQSAAALAATARVLPAELCPTIFQLPTLLSDEKWRAAVLPFLPRASQQFWLDRFPRLSIEAITPLTNMVDRLRASAAITELLGASQSTYRVREAMDQGKIVLACPGSGGTRDRLIANLLVFDLLHAAKGRADLPPDARRPFWVFLDEVQSYDGATSGNLAALLEQSAKYGMRAFLLNQNPERLSPDTLNALTTNRSHLITTALNSHAAGLITREWGGHPDPAAITALPKYQFIAQVTHHGEPSRPFAVAGVSVEEVFGPPPKLEAGAAADTTDPGQAVGDVATHLETLDGRILKKLHQLRGDQSPRSQPAQPTGPSYTPVRAAGQGRQR